MKVSDELKSLYLNVSGPVVWDVNGWEVTSHTLVQALEASVGAHGESLAYAIVDEVFDVDAEESHLRSEHPDVSDEMIWDWVEWAKSDAVQSMMDEVRGTRDWDLAGQVAACAPWLTSLDITAVVCALAFCHDQLAPAPGNLCPHCDEYTCDECRGPDEDKCPNCDERVAGLQAMALALADAARG